MFLISNGLYLILYRTHVTLGNRGIVVMLLFLIQLMKKSIPQIADIAICIFLFIYKDCLNDKYKKIGVKPQNQEPYTYFIL